MKLKPRILEFCKFILFWLCLALIFSATIAKSNLYPKVLIGLKPGEDNDIRKPMHSQTYQDPKPRQQQVPQSEEQRLLQDLTRCYDRSVRPVDPKTNKVVVRFYLKLIQIIEINEKRQQLSVNVWVTQKWRNEALTWDPAQYGGIDVVNVHPSLVWFPEILLHNNAKDTFSGGTHKYKTKIIMKHNGSQTWYSAAFFTSTCKINVERFPFDEQKCELKFGPWSHDIESIDVGTDENEADVGDFMPNGEWDLVSFPAVKHYTKYKCCKTPFAEVTFTLHIQRKTLYYFYTLVVPCSLITLLVTMGFYLPPASGQRVTLCITVLFSMTVFLNVANNKLPVTSEHVPLIAKLYMACILQMILSTASSCIVLHCYHRSHETSYLPLWFTKILVPKLAVILYVDNARYRRRKTADVRVQTEFSDNTLDNQLVQLQSTNETLNSIRDLEDSTDSFTTRLAAADREYLPLYCTMAPFRRLLHLPPAENASATRERHRKTRGIKILVNYVRRKQLKAKHELEMEFIARVLDRLCIVGFFAILIVSVVVILNG